jgi:hypothetical protein
MSITAYDFDPMAPPGEGSWSGHEGNDDSTWAYRRFHGKNENQAFELFDADVIESADNINFMPNEAFKYYLVALARYVDRLNFDSADNAAAATSCLFGYLEENTKSRPVVVSEILPIILPVLQRLASEQKDHDMPIDIYGDLVQRAEGLEEACRGG